MNTGLRSKIAAALWVWLPRRLSSLYSPQVWLESLGKGRLRHGPFAGLRYPDAASRGAQLPRYAGCYELEIQPWIEEVIRQQHPRHIHAGAGEGYFACGFASRLPQCQVIAYEMDASGRELLGQTVAANHLERQVTIKGACTTQSLAGDLEGSPALVFMDVEGAEVHLLDPAAIPELTTCDIIVELHELLQPGIGAGLRARFQESHEIEEVASRERSLRDLPVSPPAMIRLFRRQALVGLLDEGRGGSMSWLWMRPRKSAGAVRN